MQAGARLTRRELEARRQRGEEGERLSEAARKKWKGLLDFESMENPDGWARKLKDSKWGLLEAAALADLEAAAALLRDGMPQTALSVSTIGADAPSHACSCVERASSPELHSSLPASHSFYTNEKMGYCLTMIGRVLSSGHGKS